MPGSEALLVDLYELTMADAYRRQGLAERPATFSLFVRELPPGRSCLVAAGIDDVLDWLERLSFGPEEIAGLERLGLLSRELLELLAGLRFTGTVRAVPEGTIVFPNEPILEVDAPILQAQLAETYLLNQITLQTALATTAARCREAAAGRAVVDFALRRTPGTDAGMKLARVAGLVGLAGTSNVAGALRYGLPASGTMAHSFVQAFANETDAFRAYAALFGPRTVLLVDTYDTRQGVEHAITVAREARARGVELAGIRIDSGDLGALARAAREALDAAGFPNLQIVVSGGLDEHAIARLVASGAPIDAFGVGASLALPREAPSLDTAYKLVEIDGRPVRKTSPGKESWPGRKQVWRARDWSEDVLALASEPPPGAGHVPLLVEVMRDGRRTEAGRRTLAEARAHFASQWAELPAALRRLDGAGKHPVRISPALAAAARALAAARDA